MLTLREYQEKILYKMNNCQKGGYIINIATGLGKTVIFTHYINTHPDLKILVLAHREELIQQPLKYIYTDSIGIEQATSKAIGNENVIIACVPSLIKRLEKYPNNYFDVIITDECFPAGTLIDNKPIENIKCGDIITSYNHKLDTIEYKKVLNTFKSIPKLIVVVKLTNGKEIICTGNHPFYTKQGYKPAINLNENDEVYNMSKRSNRETFKNTQICLLFKRMFFSKIKLFYGSNKQKTCIKKDEGKQSNEKSRDTEKSFRQIKRNCSLSKNKMWKWCRYASCTTKFIDCIKRIRTIFRIPSNNKSIYDSSNEKQISNLLQSRHCNTPIYDSNRDRWLKSYIIKKTRTRQEKRNNFIWIRVESVKIQEQTSNGTFGGVCKGSYVYNLEIQDNNNYFVNDILVHNCHHSPCESYEKIYKYFKGYTHFGFTATVNRADNVRLDKIFDKILYEKNLIEGIKEGYLSNIHCLRFYMNYDLSKCRTAKGDYQVSELEKIVDTIENSQAIARIYKNHAIGSTLIFGISVAHCESIQQQIPNSVLVTAKTKDREQIIKDFTDGKIPCLINCMVFTEGTDIPRVETLIIARPTKNQSLYVQMVGRGLRLFEGKENLLLIDCCGVTNNNLCTAPTLLGIEMMSQKKKENTRDDFIEGDLFDLPEKIQKAEDKPFNWIINHRIVDLFAKKIGITTHNINFFKMPNGDLTLKFQSKDKTRKVNIIIPAPDSIGLTKFGGKQWKIQDLLDRVYIQLCNKYPKERLLWDLEKAKYWARGPITEAQEKLINRMLPNYNTKGLNKLEATFIINRLINKRR